MKLKYLAVVWIVIIFSTSCSRIVEVLDFSSSPDVALFESAERKYAASEYDQALELYERYLEEYPEAGMIPAALLKIGMIRTQKGEFEASREMYAKVIGNFPGTDFAGWARVETLFSYLREGRPDMVFGYAEKLEMHQLTRDMRMRVHTATGDAYLGKRAYDDAFSAFLDAFIEASESQRAFIGKRLMSAASYLEMEVLEAIIDDLGGREPSGYLTYQMGLRLAQEGRISDAIGLLSDFQRHYPRHPLMGKVVEKVMELQALAFFEDHRIGVLLPLTGQYENFGRNALKGIELALADYSNSAQINPPLEIIVYDTGADRRQTVKGVRALVDKQVAAIVGPIVMADAAVEEAQKLGIPIIALSQKSDVTKAGDYVFRNFLTAEMQVETLVAYTSGKLGLKKYAILYPDETYGEMFLHLFWDKVLENDGIVVGVEKYDSRKTDFSSPIKKLVGLYYDVPDELKVILPVEEQLFDVDIDLYEDDVPALVAIAEEEVPEEDEEPEAPMAVVDFDAVFIPDSGGVAGLIIPQLRYYDINDVHLVGTNLWHSDRLISNAGRQLRQVIIPEGFFAQSRNPKVNRFVVGFSDIYEHAPGFIEASAYDSAMILFELITLPEVDNRVALKNALLSMPAFDGLTGRTQFDETGEAVKDLYLLEVTRGRFLEIRK